MNTMSNETRTLQPGYLVSLKTVLAGNVRYTKRDLEVARTTDNGAVKSSWETERTINDPVEFEQGKIARSKCRSLITSICAQSAFGLLCPESRLADLETAIFDARNVAQQFNNTARLSRIGVYVIKGKIARDDIEASNAIASEMRDLMAEMQDGIRNLDPEKIRAAATKARNVGQMLSPAMQEKIQVAIDTARKSARAITKAGESAAIEVDQLAIEKIDQSRMAFLDLDVLPVPAPTAQVESDMDARAIDFEPVPAIATAAISLPQFDI